MLRRAQMMDARRPRILGSLPSCTVKDKFMKALAVESAEYLADQGAGKLSGPFIDIILSLRHKLSVELLDLWKEVSIYVHRDGLPPETDMWH